jgi:hypothetical protein
MSFQNNLRFTGKKPGSLFKLGFPCIKKNPTVLNSLSTTPWRRMGEWRYSCTILDLGTRSRWVDSFMPLPLYPREKTPRTYCAGGWVGPRAVWTLRIRQKTLPEIESQPSSSYPVAMPTELISHYTMMKGFGLGKRKTRNWNESITGIRAIGNEN